MIPGSVLLDAFINTNILLCVAFALWYLVAGVLGQIGLKHAYSAKLSLLKGVFLAIIFAPLAVLVVRSLQNSGLISGVNVNLSDIVVSHYLSGGFDMPATEFQNLIMMRETLTLNVTNGAGWLAWALIAAFAVGFAIGLVRLIVSMLCLRRIVGSSFAWRSFGRIRIRLSDQTMVPFSTRGLRNYYVVIPSHMLANADEMKVSLAHEFQHIRQGDLEWEILFEALKPLFFLNPAFHAWKRRIEDLRELACDSEVLKRGRVGIRAYCDTLLAVCQKTLRKDRAFVIAVPKVTLVTADRSAFQSGKVSFLEQRITSLLDMPRIAHQRLIYAAALLPLVAAIVLTSLSIQRPADWSQDRLMLSTVVNLERLDKINKLSTFGRIRD